MKCFIVLIACFLLTGIVFAEMSNDDTINAAVRAALDQSQIGRDVLIDSQNGVVELNGEVATQAEADRIFDIVQGIPGVINVRSKIQIGSSPTPAPAPPRERIEPPPSSDEQTGCAEAMIRVKLLDQGIVTKSPDSIVSTPETARIFTPTTPQLSYDSQTGVVTLNGSVRSNEEEDRIVRVLRGIGGVRKVVSSLTIGAGRIQRSGETTVVRSSVEQMDADLTRAVKTKLSESGIDDARSLRVDTYAGTVTLTGSVKSKDEEAEILQLVRQLPNVKDVISQLQIRE